MFKKRIKRMSAIELLKIALESKGVTKYISDIDFWGNKYIALKEEEKKGIMHTAGNNASNALVWYANAISNFNLFIGKVAGQEIEGMTTKYAHYKADEVVRMEVAKTFENLVDDVYDIKKMYNKILERIAE